MVDHAVNLGGPGAEGSVEEVNGVLVATALVTFDESSADSGGGDGDVPTDDGILPSGDEVPPLESFVAGLPAQLRALLNEQGRGAELRGFDLRSQAVFWAGANVAAGMNDLWESSASLFEGMRTSAALGSIGTVEGFDWSVLWRPMVGAGQQIGDAVTKSGEDLGKQLLSPLPAAAQDRPLPLDVPLPKPTGTEQTPPDEVEPQGLLPRSSHHQRLIANTVASAVLRDEKQHQQSAATFLSLSLLLGYVFGSSGPFAAEEQGGRKPWYLDRSALRLPRS